MSDGQGFGYGLGGTSNAATDDFILDFDPETTDGIFGELVPEGTHKFMVNDLYEIKFTTDGEAQIIVPTKVVESNVPGAMNSTHFERILIPGNERRANDPDKWKNMMKFLRLRLEGITGREFRENNLSLNPADLFPVGLLFIATVEHKESEKDGRKFKNANLSNYSPAGGASRVPSEFGGFGGMGAAPSAEEPL